MRLQTVIRGVAPAGAWGEIAQDLAVVDEIKEEVYGNVPKEASVYLQLDMKDRVWPYPAQECCAGRNSVSEEVK